MHHELRQLIDRLSPPLLSTLESAAADCARQGHASVELEHWIWQLLSSANSGFGGVASEAGLRMAPMMADLETRLGRLDDSYRKTPALASSLVEVMQDAWMIASLNTGQNQILLSHVLLALVNRESFMLESSPLTDELRKLSRENLQALVEKGEQAPAVGQPQMTAALDKYTHNLTAQAKAGEIDMIIGRQDEIHQMIDVLSRRRQNNPILVGDPGVGKTAVVEGLARSLVTPDVPDNLKGVELRTLDLALLQAGASIKGEFEKRLQDVIHEVQSSAVPIILFIDEAHTLIGAGGAAGQNDAANLLKPALARGALRTIAATTWAEYKKYFERDAALTRRFQLVKVPEPGEEDAVAMVRGMADSLEEYHDVQVLDSAIEAAVRLSVRYLTERQLPDKAISLLDTACARTKLSSCAATSQVDDQSVAQVVESWTGIPTTRMMADETHRLLMLEETLQQRVIGQPRAINAISEVIRINRAGLGDTRRPLGVFLMCGPSGVGKTETAIALADLLFGGEHNLITINMTEFKEEHKVSSLLGAPAGYVGYGEGGVLTEAIRRKPHSVLLLDEMEKAHSGVHDIFYRIFDKGRIADSEGREVDFRNTLIIMTSNAADFAICDWVDAHNNVHTLKDDEHDILEDIQDDLLQHFKPAFLVRTHVVPYLPLKDGDMQRICRIALKRIENNVTEKYQAEFEVDQKAIEQIVMWNNSPHIGARAIEQIVHRKLLPLMAKECLVRTGKGLGIHQIQVGIQDRELSVVVS